MEVKRLTIRLDDGKPDDVEILGFLARLDERGDTKNLQLWLKRCLCEGVRKVERSVPAKREIVGDAQPVFRTMRHGAKKPAGWKKRDRDVPDKVSAPMGMDAGPSEISRKDRLANGDDRGPPLAMEKPLPEKPLGNSGFATVQATPLPPDAYGLPDAPVPPDVPVQPAVPAQPVAKHFGSDMQGKEETSAGSFMDDPKASVASGARQPTFAPSDSSGLARRSGIFSNPDEMRLDIPTPKEAVQQHLGQQRLANLLKSVGGFDDDSD
ncbi:hypothetical protein HFU84_08460 [Acidithiobacillus sp. CV18-2]|nr:hypothetical protein [Acidithiobacillus sp. CV18-3]MBU2756923.1 hypothetical protein [Acidithiobacillus sp. BN09-2]MBU2777534.1 hypothetical protein [Acidithiobacillus sp. CV18-2]MBU2799634.1 hypothetical protein [Acidithiobacillus sp. VAN18-4]